MSELVWSKAGTHCEYCGKQEATQVEWDIDHDEHEQDKPESDCWCMTFCWQDCEMDQGSLLMSTVREVTDAEQTVIADLKAGAS